MTKHKFKVPHTLVILFSIVVLAVRKQPDESHCSNFVDSLD